MGLDPAVQQLLSPLMLAALLTFHWLQGKSAQASTAGGEAGVPDFV